MSENVPVLLSRWVKDNITAEAMWRSIGGTVLRMKGKSSDSNHLCPVRSENRVVNEEQIRVG